jgi:hypothetical protein
MLSGFAFFDLPKDAIPNREIALLIGVMGSIAPATTWLIALGSFSSIHRQRLANRLHEETPASTRVDLVFCDGEKRTVVDEGIIVFEGGTLRYIGMTTAFSLGKDHVEGAYGAAGSRQELSFSEGGETRQIAFDETKRAGSDLAHVLRTWLQHAPADATFEPPPSAPPASFALNRLKGLLPWLAAFAVVRLQLYFLPAQSPQILSFTITFLALLGLTGAITIIQSVVVSGRVYKDPPSLLLDHTHLVMPQTTSPTEDSPVDAPAHQAVAG